MSVSPHPTDMNHRREDTSRAVDCTDWLKCAALVCAMLDHFGHFFMDDDRWWGVVGRLAAPTFFFLIGYAATRNRSSGRKQVAEINFQSGSKQR